MLITTLDSELSKAGFTFSRQTSAHRIYHDWLGRPLVIATHGRAIKHTGQLKAIRAEIRALRSDRHPPKRSA